MAILKYRDKNGNFVVLPTGGMRELPIASTEVLGGVKIGENLTITEDGTLNAKASGTSVLSPGAILYDIEEKVIGKWINGKPLYQKVGEIDTSIVDKIVYQSKDPYISIIPSMNQDETDEIKITAAGNSENNPPYRAFDKSYTGYEVCWYHNTLPTWIQVQFKTKPKKINKIKIGQEIATPEFFKTYIIQGSNDGTTYTDIATFVENYHSAGQIYEHTFENENSYSYYRIYFPDNGGTVAGVSVEEIDLFEIDYTDVITYYTKTVDAENSFNIGMVENINSVIMSKNEYNNQASISKNMVYFLTDNVEKLYCIKNGVFVDEAGEHSIHKDAGTPVVNENHVCTDGSIAIEMYWSSSYNNNGVSILYKPNFPLNQRTLVVELNADTSIINNLSRIFYEGDGSYWNCINQSGNYSKSLILTSDQLTYTLGVSSYNEPTYIGIGTGINNKLYIENMYFEIRG